MGISIGSVTLEDPVILAPMSGVSDLPFRRLVKRLGAGLVVSEMIASEAMVRDTRQSITMAKSCTDEQPMAVQLAGCEPRVMAEAAKLNADRGARIIDINFGCPVKKVVNGQAGSALMRDESHAARILEATVGAVDLPVTLKMRTGWDDRSRNAPRLARIDDRPRLLRTAVVRPSGDRVAQGPPTGSRPAGPGAARDRSRSLRRDARPLWDRGRFADRAQARGLVFKGSSRVG